MSSSSRSKRSASRYLFMNVTLMVISLLMGCGLERNVIIESDPPDAEVLVDGVKQNGRTPTQLLLEWDDETQPRHEIVIQKETFQEEQVILNSTAVEKMDDPHRIKVSLDPLTATVQVRFSTEPATAEISIDGGPYQSATTTLPILFVRKSGNAPWETCRAVIRAEDYESAEVILEHSQVSLNPEVKTSLKKIKETFYITIETQPTGADLETDNGFRSISPRKVPLLFKRSSSRSPWSVAEVIVSKTNYDMKRLSYSYEEASSINEPQYVNLDEIYKSISMDITSNIQDAEVEINGNVEGKTPFRYDFAFERDSGNDPWNTFLVKVNKKGYRRKPKEDERTAGENQPFQARISYDLALKGELVAELSPILYLRTPIKSWRWSEKGAEIEEKTVLSLMNEIDPPPMVASVSPITKTDAENAFMDSRNPAPG